MAKNLLATSFFVTSALGCSNLLVSPGASADGSSILTYNSDDMGLFGSLDLRPSATHPPGSLRAIWDWDGQYYTGNIPEVNQTYNVVGNINEWGLIITETTFGGRDDLDGHGTGAIMSYGDLIFTTLQRAKTAREAIQVMDNLCQTYGYESNGESFGVGNSTEVWLLELVGKGKYGKGAVWVASKIPDGFVGSTANQARTETFNQNDPDNVLFSADLISFARSIGAFPSGSPDSDFNFREAFDPITFGGARFGEARVWNLLNPVCGGCLDANLDFAQGYNLKNSMPLFVKSVNKLSLNDTAELMRTHFENTWFDNTGNTRPDIGAAQGHSPYRFRPLTWSYNNKTYLNERTVGVQQSGWSFLAQSRNWLPDPIKAITWFAPDDSSTSPHTPFYGCATRIAPSFGSLVGQTPGGGVPYAPVADAFTMSMDSAFWLFNLVGNLAFSERYSDAKPVILKNVYGAQTSMFAAAAQVDKDFVALYPVDPAAAIEMVTRFGETNGEAISAQWRNLFYLLFATFRDGGILLPSTAQQCVGNQTDNCVAKLQPIDSETGYDEQWRGRIVNDSDNAIRYLVPDAASEELAALETRKMKYMSGKNKRRV